MQWQPRSMIAPPPVSRPSQNHAECGPGMRLARADPRDVADRAGLDRAHGLERLRRVAEVLEVAAEHARPLDDVEDPLRLVRRPPQRLRAEDRLAGLRREPDRLLVEEVRDADDDDVGVGVVDRRRHVRRRLGDAPALAEGLAAILASRVDDADAVLAALAVERLRVELADQPGPEHRDLVGRHAGDLLGDRSVGRPASAADQVAAGDERLILAIVERRAVWLKPQSGTSVSRAGGTPASSTGSIRPRPRRRSRRT